MDKESFFQILEEMCSYNIENYFTDLEWYTESLISQVGMKAEFKEESQQEKIQKRIEGYHSRKAKLFQKLSTSYNKNLNSTNTLSLIPNHPAEQYAYNNDIEWSKFDFSTGEEAINKFYELMVSIKTYEEVFYQPVNEEFDTKCYEFLKNQFFKEKTLSNELIRKAITSYFLVLLYQGKLLRLYLVYKEFSSNEKFQQNFAPSQLELTQKMKCMFDNIYNCDNNYNPYKIMRNYSISDAFNISKNILFSGLSAGAAKNFSSITTDGTYIYIIGLGICGGIYKVGTGKNNTIKGKCYLANTSLNSTETNPYLVYVKETNRLYYKTAQMEIGTIRQINPETLTIEKIIKLNLPEMFKLIKDKKITERNANAVLLSDEKHLYLIGIECESSSEGIDKSTQYKSSQNKCVLSLILLKYPMNSEKNALQIENEGMVNELYESFSLLIPKEKCKFALEKKNYNMEKAAQHLIKHFNSEKKKEATSNSPYEDIYYSEKVVLYQNKLELNTIGGFYQIIGENKTQVDVLKFDGLKWEITGDKVLAYKLKEGACLVFSAKKDSEKEFFIAVPKVDMKMKAKPSFGLSSSRNVQEELFNKFQNMFANVKDFPNDYKRKTLMLLSQEPRQSEIMQQQKKENVSGSTNSNLNNQKVFQGNNNKNYSFYSPMSVPFSPKSGNFSPYEPFAFEGFDDDEFLYKELYTESIDNDYMGNPLVTSPSTSASTKKKIEYNSESYKGTLIKVVHCLASSTIANINESFCYDRYNGKYYILAVSILSLSILVSNTFEKEFESEKSRIEAVTKSSLAKALTDPKSYFSNLDKIILYTNLVSFSLPWYYANWNFFYSKINLTSLATEDHMGSSYPYRLFYKTSKGEYENLEKKIVSSTTECIDTIIKKIENLSGVKVSLGGNELSNPTPETKTKKKLPYVHTKAPFDFNWSGKREALLKTETKEDVTKLKNIGDKRVHLIANYKKIFGVWENTNLLEEVSSQEGKKNANLKLIFDFYFIKHFHILDLYHIKQDNVLAKKLIEIKKSILNHISSELDEATMDVVIDIIKYGYEILFPKLPDQFRLFTIALSSPKNEKLLDLLLEKMDLKNYVKNILFNNINSVNEAKYFSLSTTKSPLTVSLLAQNGKYNRHSSCEKFYKILLKENHDIWKILTKEITAGTSKKNQEKMIRLLIHLFILAAGEQDLSNADFIQLFNKSYSILAKMIVNITPSNATKEIIPIDIISFTHILIFSFYSRISSSGEKLIEIDFFLSENQILFKRLLTAIQANLPNLDKLKYLGLIEKEKKLEICLKDNYIISQAFKFDESNTIIVTEIETTPTKQTTPIEVMISQNEKISLGLSSQKDIFIKSNNHQTKFINNNHRDFGTCFSYKVSNHCEKSRFYLLGNEVTVAFNINANEKISSSINDLKSKEIIIVDTSGSKGEDFKLIVRCYPFKRHRFGAGKFSIDCPEIERVMELVNDCDFINNEVIRKVINYGVGEKCVDLKFSRLLKYEINKVKDINLYFGESFIEKTVVQSLFRKNQNKILDELLNVPYRYFEKEVLEEINEVENIKINNLNGINRLSSFNISIWNLAKNTLYYLCGKCIKDITKEDKENFISDVMNKIAMKIKRSKVAFDVYKNLVSDIIEMDSKNSNFVESVNSHIENEVKAMFFSNEASLNEICSVLKLNGSSSPEGKMKSLNEYYMNEIDKLLNYTSVLKEQFPLTKDQRTDIEISLKERSPFISFPMKLYEQSVLLFVSDTVTSAEEVKKFLLEESNFEEDNIRKQISKIITKYHSIALTKFAFEKYHDIYSQNLQLKNYDKLFVNSHGIFSPYFSFSDEFPQTELKSKIDFVVESKSKILLEMISNIDEKQNIVFQLSKIILLCDDIEKILSKISVFDISGIISESLDKIFTKENYKIQNFDNVLTSLTSIIKLLSKRDPAFTLKIIELLSKFLSATDNSITSTTNAMTSVISNLNFVKSEALTKALDTFIGNVFSILTKIKSTEAIVSLCEMSKIVMKNADYVPCFEMLYAKVGELFLSCVIDNSEEAKKEVSIKTNSDQYKLIFNVNSDELDYVFLINALYYFEEEYPTRLSLYKTREDIVSRFSIEDIRKKNLIELFSNVDFPEKNEIITLEINKKEEAQNQNKSNSNQGSMKDILPLCSLTSIMKKSMTTLPCIKRLKNKHSKTYAVTKKCENVLGTLFRELEAAEKEGKPTIKIKKNILHLKRILTHINLTENIGKTACIKGFAILQPKFKYKQAMRFSELVNLSLNYEIKSPPLSVEDESNLFTYEEIFPPLPQVDDLIEGYTNVIKETTQNFANVTVINESIFNKILETNLERIDLNVKVSSGEYSNGEGVRLNMSYLLDLIYSIVSQDVSVVVKDFLNSSDSDNEALTKLIGILIVCSGEHDYIIKGMRCQYKEKECIISNNNGGVCEIQFTDGEKAKVNIDDLVKLNNSTISKLISSIKIDDVAKMFIKFSEKSTKGLTDEPNSLIDFAIHLLLKFMSQKLKQSKEEKVSSEILPKLKEKLGNYSKCTLYIPSVPSIEREFSTTLIRKFNKKSVLLSYHIFTPRYNVNKNPPVALLKDTQINPVLPESEYTSSLPKANPNKCFTCLYNAIKFDRILVDAIINAYKNDKYPNAVAMSTSQIRSYVLNGNLKSAYADLSTVFGGAPITKTIFTEDSETTTVSKDKVIVGKVFLFNDTKSLLRPVIILLTDFTNQILLVMSIEDSIDIFWTTYDTLIHVNKEYPSSSYSDKKINREFKDAFNELNAMYSNSIIESIQSCDVIRYAHVCSWMNDREEAVEKIKARVSSNPDEVKELSKYALEKWNSFASDIKIKNFNLFECVKYNNGTVISLNRLCDISKAETTYEKVIITFDSKAFLGPQACMKFYADEEKKELLAEIRSIKKERNELPSVVVNRPKVYFEYIPGTTIFYSSEWFMHSRDSFLQCSIAFVPNYFTSLLNITKVVSHLSISEYISTILSNCINSNYPIKLQMKMISILNVILSSNMNQIGELIKNVSGINEKLAMIGVKREILNTFIKTFDELLSTQKKEKYFASPYLIELSDCIMNIFSVLGEKYEDIFNYLSNEHKILIKLYQILQCLARDEVSEEVNKEICDELNKYKQDMLSKIIVVKSQEDVKTILTKSGCVIRDYPFDVLSIEDKIYVFIDEYKGSVPHEEPKEEEEPLWECSNCHQENDKDNTSCVYCDAPKKPVIKPKKPKKDPAKEVPIVKDTKEIVNQLKNSLPKDKITVIETDDAMISKYLIKRVESFSQEYVNEKLVEISKYIEDKDRLEKIKKILTTSRAKVTSEDVDYLFSSGLDLYLDVVTQKNYKITQKDIRQISSLISTEPLKVHTAKPQTISLAQTRYNLALMNKINHYLESSLPLINPPLSHYDTLNTEASSLSSLLTKMRYITSFKIKSSLLNSIIDQSEFGDDLIQIPTFKVDRITTASSMSNNQSNASKLIFEGLKKKEIIDAYYSPFSQILGSIIGKRKPPQSEFMQVFEQSQRVDVACYRSKRVDRDHNAFKIEYVNELVQGLSGPYRQFFSDIANDFHSEALNAKTPYNTNLLIIPTQNNVNKKGEFKDKFTINPRCEEFSQLEFLGILMGISIRTGVYLSLDFCSLIWKRLVGEAITLEDIKQFDEGLFQMITLLRNDSTTKEELEAVFPEKKTLLSDGTTFVDIPGEFDFSLPADRKRYSEALISIRVYNECKKQLQAIKKGISKMIPLSILQFFTHVEFQTLICGKKVVDINLLKANTVISDELNQKEYLTTWLWQILDEFDESDRVNFVKFCYAQETLPPSQEEYTKRQVVFTIKFNPQSKKDLLPRADTCFFFLILPDYSSKEVMKKMIKIAIQMDNVGMNGDKIEGQGDFSLLRGSSRRGRGNNNLRGGGEKRRNFFGSGFDDDYEDY